MGGRGFSRFPEFSWGGKVNLTINGTQHPGQPTACTRYNVSGGNNRTGPTEVWNYKNKNTRTSRLQNRRVYNNFAAINGIASGFVGRPLEGNHLCYPLRSKHLPRVSMLCEVFGTHNNLHAAAPVSVPTSTNPPTVLRETLLFSFSDPSPSSFFFLANYL